MRGRMELGRGCVGDGLARVGRRVDRCWGGGLQESESRWRSGRWCSFRRRRRQRTWKCLGDCRAPRPWRIGRRCRIWGPGEIGGELVSKVWWWKCRSAMMEMPRVAGLWDDTSCRAGGSRMKMCCRHRCLLVRVSSPRMMTMKRTWRSSR